MRIALLFVAMLTGCAGTWTHPTATEAQFYRDVAECRSEAMAMYRPAPPVAGPIYTTCSGYGTSAHCTSTGGTTNTLDFSGIAQAAHQQGCLMARGYKHQ